VRLAPDSLGSQPPWQGELPYQPTSHPAPLEQPLHTTKYKSTLADDGDIGPCDTSLTAWTAELWPSHLWERRTEPSQTPHYPTTLK
jgi:hypothetical protein